MVITTITEGGGVGKTALTFNLAWCLANRGKRVLMIDLDAQGGNLSFFAGVKNKDKRDTIVNVFRGEKSINDVAVNLKENLWIVPGNQNLMDVDSIVKKEKDGVTILKNEVGKIKKKYDYIFIDVNPTPSMIHVISLMASEGMIIPTVPDAKCVASTMKVIETYEDIKKGGNPKLKVLGIVFNEVEDRSLLAKGVIQTIASFASAKGVPIMQTIIPKNIAIGEQGFTHIGITEYKPKSKGALAYVELCDEMFGKAGE